MKLLSFLASGRAGFGALTPEGVADLSGVPWPTLQAAIATADEKALADRVARMSGRIPLEQISFLPPIPNPGKIICVGMAFRSHTLEAGHPLPVHPTLFLRVAESFVGHGEPVIRPSLSHTFDFEAELGVVIGKPGRHISAESAMEHVLGYTCIAENSVREYQQHSTQATAGKNFDRSGAIGPYIVTQEDVPDPTALTLIGRLNGVEMQRAVISDLIFPVAPLIAYISSFMTLQPGDVISTGTPSGVGAWRKPPLYMQPGDLFEVEIPGVGLLANRVTDEAPR